MQHDLERLFNKAKEQAGDLVAILNAIKSHPEAKRVILDLDDSNELLANECDTVLMFIEGISDWEVAE